MSLVGFLDSRHSPMSTTSAAASQSTVPAWKRECYDHASDVAEEILDHIRGDHRYCANCFRKIRTVEIQDKSRHKKRHLADATQHSHGGTVEQRRLAESPPDLDAPPGHPDGERSREWRTVGTRLGIQCECGMGHHRRRNRPVKKHVGVRYVRNLSQAIHDLRGEFATGSDADYAKIERWNHHEDALAASYKRIKTQSDGGNQGCDVIERALTHRFLAQQL